MEPLESFFRPKNITFYLQLEKADTVKDAAARAGLALQHATRLVKLWRDNEWIARSGTLHGSRYRYTDKGKYIKDKLFLMSRDFFNGR